VIKRKRIPHLAGRRVASSGGLLESLSVLAEDEELTALAAPLIFTTTGRFRDTCNWFKGNMRFPGRHDRSLPAVRQQSLMTDAAAPARRSRSRELISAPGDSSNRLRLIESASPYRAEQSVLEGSAQA
jgi:hypothetical protein